jgi:hypothetical protein
MFRILAFASLFAVTTANARQGDLWSLYVYEQSVDVCGLQLNEEQEDALDAAQQRARIELSLSQKEAADLYRRARETVRASRQEICTGQLQTGSIQR